MLVRVYRNNHRNQWAVVNAKTRRVAFYADELTLVDVRWHAGPKDRICKSGHKNRHTYAEGRLRSFSANNTRTQLPRGEHQLVLDERGPRIRGLGARKVERSYIAEFTTYGKVYVECAC